MMNSQKIKRKQSLIFMMVTCIFLITLLGCGGQPVWLRDDPEDVVAGFLSAVEVQDTDTVWEFLSSSTRNELEKRAENFNQMPDHGTAVQGRDMLRFGHVLSSTREYKKIELKSSDQTHATVQIVLHDESVIPVELHRESNRWTLDLPLPEMEIK